MAVKDYTAKSKACSLRKKFLCLLMAVLLAFTMSPASSISAFADSSASEDISTLDSASEDVSTQKRDATVLTISSNRLASGGITPLAVAPPATVNISGTSSLSVATGTEYAFTQNDAIEVTGDSGYTYRAVPVSVAGSDTSYSFTHASGQDDYPTSFTPAASDASKTYTITYRAQYYDTDDNVWVDAPSASDFTVTLGVVGAQSHAVVVGDNARVSSISISVTNDGTAVWDSDDEPGNDSGPSNGIVRTFDNVDYALTWTTEAKNAADTYEYGRTYFEVVLPTTKDKATFDTATMGAYMQDWELVEADGKQTLKFYYEARSTNTSHAMPALTQIPLHVKVLAAANGDIIKPTVTASVEYYADESKSNPQTSGSYDVPVSATADDVRVTAAPSYNVQLRQSNYTDTIATFDFTTGNDKALDKDAGDSVYGRIRAFGITLQLYNPVVAKGLKGIELPQGDITFDIDLSQIFKTETDGTEYNVQAPFVWSASAVDTLNSSTLQDGRSLTGYSTYLYAVGAAPRNKHTGSGTSAPSGGTVQCWNGGNWSFAKTGDTIHVTVSDYVINTDWFPNANQGNGDTAAIYFNPSEGVQNIGCFSSGELFLVFPFGGDSKQSDEYYPNKYRDDGGLIATIKDTNLKASSVSGQVQQDAQGTNDAQAQKSDDTLNLSIELTTPGTYSPRVQYTKYGGFHGVNGDYDVDGFTTHQFDGGDISAIGNTVGISWRLLTSAATDVDNDVLYAANNLLLFDDEAFVPTGNIMFRNGGNWASESNTVFLYATKADGSGWTSDTEMKSTKEEDLVYYASLSDIPSGQACVGILAEVRVDPTQQLPGGETRCAFIAEFDIRSDASIADKVYMTSSIHRAWGKNGVLAVMESNNDTVPSRLNMSVGQTVEGSDAAAQPVVDTTNHVGHRNYEKAWYDESGFHPGSGTENRWGDSLYIQPYIMEVQKQVLQKDGVEPGVTVNFNLQNGESVVDYRVKPAFNTSGITFENFNTTVRLTDTLPAGIAYRPGSAYYGGSYTQNANPGLPVTHTGGVPLEPASIAANADGTTTLVWEIDNVPVGSNMDYLYFSCDIDQSIEGIQEFVNTVYVNSTEDIREPAAEKNNLDTATIRVAPSAAVVVKKVADQTFHNRDDVLGWNLKWTNTGSDTFPNLVMMESMPYDGDDYGTHLSNGASYSLDDDLVFTFPAGKSAADYRIYYTTDAAAHGKRAFDLQGNYADFSGDTCTVGGMAWTHATIDGTRVHTNGNTDVTAFVILGNLGARETIAVDMKLVPHDFQPGDVVVNCISVNDLSTTSSIYIVERILRGTVWIDADRDGERKTGEERVSGVFVALKVREGDTFVPAKDVSGADYVVETDANGNYEFTGLAAGEYLVEFTNNGKNLGTYRATVQNADGVDASVNSDATPRYEDEVFADISGISMPDAADITSSPYIVRYQDLGIWRPDITVSKTVDASAAGDADAQAAELAKGFLFKVTVADCPTDETFDVLDADSEVVDTVTGAQLGSGYEFSLKHGEALTLAGVPASAAYTVEEFDYSTYGYTTTTTGDALSGTMDADKAIAFANTYAPETVDVAVQKPGMMRQARTLPATHAPTA